MRSSPSASRPGPPPVPNRTGISSTLKIGGDLYQIDCGLGSLNAFADAVFRFDGLKSMFITHLRTDHIVDQRYPPRPCGRRSPKSRTALPELTFSRDASSMG